MTAFEHLKASVEVKKLILSDGAFLSKIDAFATDLTNHLRKRTPLYVFGNGGSAGDAQHFCAELVGFYKKDQKAYPAVALTTDTSFLTAWGNDVSFDSVFSRQLSAHGKVGDACLAISTSGMSKNVVWGLEKARLLGMKTFALLGKGGGDALKHCDHALVVPSDVTAHIQEVHITLIHIICNAVVETA